MRSLDFCRFALSMGVAASMLAGCGGSQPPTGAPGAKPQSSAITRHDSRGKSWMLPGASGEDLLYVSLINSKEVDVFSYNSHNQVGMLSGILARGLCVDSTGNVFITVPYAPEVLEYAHGGTKPINTFKNAGHEPAACSVDPTTGNLAVLSSEKQPLLTIFRRDRKHAHTHNISSLAYGSYCAYDGNGNLFIDGLESYSPPFKTPVFELEGGKQLKRLHLKPEINASALQWDGNYLAIANLSGSSEVDQFSVQGKVAIRVGVTDLRTQQFSNQFWITNGTIVSAQGDYGYEVGYWNYPSGGDPTATIAVTGPSGVTVSLAPHR